MYGVRSSVGIELNYKAGEKVKVSPIGEFTGFDGRTFIADGNLVLADIAKNGLHIPLDESHWDGPARGWFDKNSFELREDGIYGALELTALGATLVEQKEYRYLSPAYILDSNRNVLGLDSVALVNKPNLLNKELNKKGDIELKELEKLKAENEALKKQIEETKVNKDTTAGGEQKEDKKEESNETKAVADVVALTKQMAELGAQIETIKAENKELNTKMAIFGQTTLEKNSKDTKTLSDSELKIAKQLGISTDEYLKARNEGNI
ncbi:MAG: hypothetical protein RL154_785 [Pseudomonadota bacterium]|jgi:phage I-like protein